MSWLLGEKLAHENAGNANMQAETFHKRSELVDDDRDWNIDGIHL